MKVITNSAGPGFAELDIGARGIAVVDFTVNGASDASVAVSGQSGITSTHVPMVQLACVATLDHSADEHMVEEIEVLAGAVLPGVGFPIYARTRNVELYGRWSVVWSWG